MPRPDGSAQSRSVDQQCGHHGRGWWWKRSHARQRGRRNTPRVAALQYGSVAGFEVGTGLPTVGVHRQVAAWPGAAVEVDGAALPRIGSPVSSSSQIGHIENAS